ncbi:MAG: tripartite tricarboxylate transporter substrate binding protein [Betaproteobacteria bacterium]|nr:tripartite tricarboxylate transporter substrate binding protein [Betaproteobacteria bacterium]MBK7745024.1 tripartite tricarboxylate transporter substrate binding protein [Betaproteobacteria bacterium]MBK9703780.1 tripartite tricarboxylate transporter substrate binding protein [Betaproteobacteria bacterium]
MKKLITAVALAVGLIAQAHAAYPDKAVTIIVPFPPGGSTDMVARAIAPKLQQSLGQPFVIDNRAGATGAIGATAVKNAAPDGYTFMVASIGVFAVNPFIQKKLQYDPVKDLDPITVAVRAPNVLVASPGFPANTVAELVALLKKTPEKITFATSGAGSSDHLTAALFWQKTGTTGVHVPYKGGAPAITDLLAGHADVSFQNINAVIAHIKAGKLKVLAVTGDKRSSLLPQVPTLGEAGVPDVNVFSWQGIAAPKGLPAEVKQKLHAAIVAALNDPENRKRMEDIGFEIVANTPEQMAQFQAQELARWKQVIEVGKIALE